MGTTSGSSPVDKVGRDRAVTASASSGRFLVAVDHWRRFLRLGHNAFARRLGITHGYWHQIRTGERAVSRKFAERVLAERPDLRHALSEDFLAHGRARTPSTRRGSAA